MPLLEAFLALALTMFFLAMIATLIVELVNRAAGIRAKGLKIMLEHFYDSELQPLIESELGKTGDDVKTDLINHLATNPLVKDKAAASFLRRNLAGLESLSTEDLLKRLTKTDIGRKIKSKSEQEVDAFVDSVSHTYDACGKAASELFKRNARVISFIGGIVVAFGLNVNALILFQMYLDDPHVRTQAVAEADLIVKQFEEGIKENKSENGNGNPETAINKMKNHIKELDSLGVKIGWHAEKLPLAIWKSSRPGDSSGWHALGGMLSSWTFWGWLLGVIGTGLLIGLGGPFWYDVVYKLSDLLQVAKGAGTPAPPGGAALLPPADPTNHLKETFKKTGNIAAAVNVKE